MFPNTSKWLALAAVAAGIIFASSAVLGRQQPPPKAAEPAPDSGPALRPSARKMIAIDGRIVEGAEARAGEARTRRILSWLENRLPMSFAIETPLDDVLKYIRQATSTPTTPGIPIYVDPIGLQVAERSLNSTVQIDVEGVPLRRTLQLILAQLGLAYFVEDGLLVITSEELADRGLPPAIREPSPILEKAERARRGVLSVAEMKELIEVFRLRGEVIRLAKRYPEAPDADPTEQLIQEIRQLIGLLRNGEPIPRRQGLQ